MRTSHFVTKTAVLPVLLLATVVFAQEQTAQPVPAAAAPQSSSAVSPQSSPATSAAVAQKKVFVFVVRTDRHAKYSKPEVFHDVLDDMLEYLKAKNVAIAVDEFGGRNHAEGSTPLDTIFTIAQDAKADSVLYVEVDRPLTKWLKLTVQSFDMNRKQLWKEEVSNGGGLSGGHGFKACTENLHKLLDKRVGQDGLPVLAEVKPSEAVKQ